MLINAGPALIGQGEMVRLIPVHQTPDEHLLRPRAFLD